MFFGTNSRKCCPGERAVKYVLVSEAVVVNECILFSVVFHLTTVTFSAKLKSNYV